MFNKHIPHSQANEIHFHRFKWTFFIVLMAAIVAFSSSSSLGMGSFSNIKDFLIKKKQRTQTQTQIQSINLCIFLASHFIYFIKMIIKYITATATTKENF